MVAFLIVISVFCVIRGMVAKKRPASYGPTWGCGYQKPIKSIQYTSKSFAKTLINMCHSLLPSSQMFKPIENDVEIFPENRSHISVDFDFVDEKMISPGSSKLLSGLERFQFIQNGMLQRYIVYGLAYVVILILSVVVFG